MWLKDQQSVTETDLEALRPVIQQIIDERQPFERLQVSRAFAHRVFEYSPWKTRQIDAIPADQAITLYRCGPFVDLCRGPHVPHTGALLGTVYDRTMAMIQMAARAKQRRAAIASPRARAWSTNNSTL